MPLYEYRCPACGAQFSDLAPIAEPDSKCPECGEADTRRLVSRFQRGRGEDERIEQAAAALQATDPAHAAEVGAAVAGIGKALDEDLSTDMQQMYDADREATE
ncbi:MAG: zinc ribbon domain-containing protein [Armatimonadetes bacterium]|nr:zinc ribbon domain-containing protein [Armatimonadota bacterium]